MEKVRERLDRAVAGLKEAGVPYAVAGGNAVAVWVSRVDESAVRTPVDVEIVLRREDFKSARAALESAGFRYAKGWMDWFLDGSCTSPQDRIAIYFAHDEILKENIAVPDVSEVDSSGPYAILDLEALVRMRLATYEFKDRVELLDLINVGLIDESWLTRFASELAARLQRLLDDPDKFRAFH